MSIREQIISILKEVKPAKDLAEVKDIVEGGYIDSFELMNLIFLINETFSVEVSVDEIVPENFDSVDAIAALAERLTAAKG